MHPPELKLIVRTLFLIFVHILLYLQLKYIFARREFYHSSLQGSDKSVCCLVDKQKNLWKSECT
ncbi:unnamed protein product [Tenebrio molitor]|nr:unnamed protein product [Tenebrio molitor]